MKVHIQLVHLLAFVYLCAAILQPPVKFSTSLKNHSLADLSSAHTNISLSHRFPYSIRIPGRPLWLQLNFIPGKTLSNSDIGGILALVNDTVHHFIEDFGEDTLLPIVQGASFCQITVSIEPHDLLFHLRSTRGAANELTFGIVRDVIKALYIFLIEGRRYNAVVFRVSTLRFLGLFKAYGLLDADIPTVEDS